MAQTLDCDEFIESCKRLYRTLTVSEKNLILAVGHKWKNEKDKYDTKLTFEPTINKRSAKIAENRIKDGETIETHLFRKRREIEERLAGIRHHKKRDELKGCTFHPQIYNGPSDITNILNNVTNYDNFDHLRSEAEQYQGLSKRYI